jgi:hypothetical protein
VSSLTTTLPPSAYVMRNPRRRSRRSSTRCITRSGPVLPSSPSALSRTWRIR